MLSAAALFSRAKVGRLRVFSEQFSESRLDTPFRLTKTSTALPGLDRRAVHPFLLIRQRAAD